MVVELVGGNWLRCHRKTHHESWSGLSSTKERFVVPQRLVASYMLLQRSARDLLLEASGFQPPAQSCASALGAPTDANPPERPAADGPNAAAAEAFEKAAAAFIAKDKKLKKAIALGEEIQEEIAEHALQPMVGTSSELPLSAGCNSRPSLALFCEKSWASRASAAGRALRGSCTKNG